MYRLIGTAFVALVFTVGIFGQTESAVELYDENKNKAIEFGWEGTSADGKCVIKQDDGKGMVLEDGNLTVDSSVTATGFVGDGSGLSNVEVADSSITTAKIANGAVTDAKIDSVSWAKIVGIPADIADGDDSGTIADSSISTAKIVDGTIDSADMHMTSIGTCHLRDGAVTNQKITAGVDGSKITAGTIPNSVLNANLQDLAEDGILEGTSVNPDFSGSSRNLKCTNLDFHTGKGTSPTPFSLKCIEEATGVAKFVFIHPNGDTLIDYYKSTDGIQAHKLQFGKGNKPVDVIVNADLQANRVLVNECISNITLCSSDRRFKKNVEPIQGALGMLDSLEGVYYYWRDKEFEEKGFGESRQVGFIAQDVEKVAPELVVTDENGYKAVSYDKMSSILVQAIKEQGRVIEALQQNVMEQKHQLEDLAETIREVSEQAR